MSAWQPEELLRPITAENPCGENLEDTPLLAAFDAFRLFGDATAPHFERPPQWQEIRERAIEGLGRSKDLRLLAYLGAALLRTDGLPAFAETLGAAASWLETYWAGTYPQVDEDAMLRCNALNCFADRLAVVDGLTRVPLVRSRQHGIVTLRALDLAAGLVKPGEKEQPVDAARLNAAFTEMPLDELQRLQATVAGMIGAIKRIDVSMREHGGTNVMPKLDSLLVQLVKAERLLQTQLAQRPDAPAQSAGAEPGEPEAVGGAAGASMRPVGAIASRQDAIRALEAVAAFFKQNEPSSPIPLFVERAKRLVAKDFLEVLADIAPEAVGPARSAGGLPQGD